MCFVLLNTGYNRDGYDVDGYDTDGYSRFGYDRDGYDRYGYDIEGWNKDSLPDLTGRFNVKGYSVECLDRRGNQTFFVLIEMLCVLCVLGGGVLRGHRLLQTLMVKPLQIYNNYFHCYGPTYYAQITMYIRKHL